MKVSSNNNEQRLQKVIAQSGVCSRRKAEELILEGKVSVNGKITKELGTKVSDADKISVNGKPLALEKYVYYLLNKPRGILSSSSDDRERKTVADLIPSNERLYPVGRLDMDTTGALILTNDGQFTHLMTHPKFHVDKTYHVNVRGVINDTDIQRIQKGFRVDGELMQPAIIKNIKYDTVKKRTQFDLTIFEGKNRQIRRMMEVLHHEVIKLHRIQIGFINVDDLKIGDYRILKPFEIKKLKALATGDK